MNAIFERRSRPPIGDSPDYVDTSIEPITGLTDSEEFIYIRTAHKSVESFPTPPPEEELREELRDHDLSEARIHEGFTALKNRGYIDARRTAGGNLALIKLTQRGWRVYTKRTVESHDNKIIRVASELANQDELWTSDEIGEALDIPSWFSAYAFRELAHKGLIEVSGLASGGEAATRKSAELERWLRLNS